MAQELNFYEQNLSDLIARNLKITQICDQLDISNQTLTFENTNLTINTDL